jgi:murein DD-endopeptidase MepM/ murein hydrolase activator NlpD
MKKIIVSLFTIVFLTNVFAQTEKTNYKAEADLFESHYNQGNYEQIFTLFSNEMQTALPLQKTIEFLSGLKRQAGKIRKRTFIKYQSSYAIYKTTFDTGIFSLNISVDNNSKINGLYIKPYIAENLPKIDRNTTKLKLPFTGSWNVIWGGDTKEQNYHIENTAQKNAFDFLIIDTSGKSYKTNGQRNEDYYAFAKKIVAPSDGEVVLVVDGIKDNTPGEMNPMYVPGNSVILKTSNNEYLVFAHFKQKSIKVKQGQQIKQGQLLGLCGNSGNSSEPHLHFHIQNIEDMNMATGVKCFFEALEVNGKISFDYSPVKGDIIKQN